MCTPAQLGAICADSTFFFFWCPVDITRELYAFVFSERYNCSPVVQGTHEYLRCSIPRYLSWNPRAFLRRICSDAEQIDVLQVGEKKFTAYSKIMVFCKYCYLRITQHGEPDVEMCRAGVEILGFARLKTSVFFLVRTHCATYLTDNIIRNNSSCHITIPDYFLKCTGILLDADKLLHIEGTLENGMTGVWTYCPNMFASLKF